MSRPAEITVKMLHAFLTWAEAGTEQEAAKILGITQPAVHRKLEKFQSQVGNGPRLLQHGQLGWELTEDGRAILPIIRDLLRRVDQLDQHLSNRDVAPRSIRMGTGSFAAQYILPQALAAFRRSLPDCHIECQQERGLNRILFTADARLDLAIVTHSPEQIASIVRKHFQTRRRLLNCESIARFPLCLAARKGSTEGSDLAKFGMNRTIPLTEIERWRLVGLDPQSGLRQRLETLADGISLTFAPETVAGGWAAAKAYARMGLGVAILPIATLAIQDAEDFTLRRFDERFVVEEYLISRADFVDSACEKMKSDLFAAAEAQCQDANGVWDHIAASGK